MAEDPSLGMAGMPFVVLGIWTLEPSAFEPSLEQAAASAAYATNQPVLFM